MRICIIRFFLATSTFLVTVGSSDAYQFSSSTKKANHPSHGEIQRDARKNMIPSSGEPTNDVRGNGAERLFSRRSLLRTAAATLSAGTLMTSNTAAPIRAAVAATDDDVATPLYFGVGVSIKCFELFYCQVFLRRNSVDCRTHRTRS